MSIPVEKRGDTSEKIHAANSEDPDQTAPLEAV